MNIPPATVTILKSSGERHPFSVEKLKKSLLRSGATPALVNAIAEKITGELYDGISTREIYRKAFNMLKIGKTGAAAKYKLKNAIMELGPTGFPFEQFIARLFKSTGYTVQTGQILQGRCVAHEVDVVARKGDEQHLAECKFHQQKGLLCDVKIPLYISARFRDIEEQISKPGTAAFTSFKGWLVTNTGFTKDALSYGLCAGLHMVGWNFPEKGSLKEWIDEQGLHPVTCLTSLTKHEKQELLNRQIVLCAELKDHLDDLTKIVNKKRIERVLEECDHINNGMPQPQTT